MKTAEELKAIYEEYIAFGDTLPLPSILNQFRQSGQPDPANHPRHQAFYEEVEDWVREFARRDPHRDAVIPDGRWGIATGRPILPLHRFLYSGNWTKH